MSEYKKIKLSSGDETIVDTNIYDKVEKYFWWVNISEHGNKYVRGLVDGKRVLLHRFILNINVREQCDHINHDGLDNRLCNLRVVSSNFNSMNRRKQLKYKNNECNSIFKGVSKHGKKWASHIRVNKKLIHLGTFNTQEEAARAYDIKAKEMFGVYAYLNFGDV